MAGFKSWETRLGNFVQAEAEQHIAVWGRITQADVEVLVHVFRMQYDIKYRVERLNADSPVTGRAWGLHDADK